MKNTNQKIVYGVFIGWLMPLAALATPSTTYWAPSTAACQAFGVPHLTYDTYFTRHSAYPIDAGLTAGIIPSDVIQAEVGLDVLYPSSDPLYFNGKLCTPESSMFAGSPGLSAGIYNMGTREDVSNYNVIYYMAQKSLPWGGYLAAGFYHGLNSTLLTGSNGKVNRVGLLAAAASPDIQIGLTGLKKVNFVADLQTGKNVLGAWGLGSNIYFADNVSLLTGPVFFLDKALQPGGKDLMWTMQLDVDISLK